MNVNDLLKRYKDAIEKDKVINGQYEIVERQLTKLLTNLGMTYEEALKEEQKLKDYLQESLPKIEAYISTVEEKRLVAESKLV